MVPIQCVPIMVVFCSVTEIDELRRTPGERTDGITYKVTDFVLMAWGEVQQLYFLTLTARTSSLGL